MPKLGTFQTAQLVPAAVNTTHGTSTTVCETGGWDNLQAVCTIITTSGTIASFGCWLEGSIDAQSWFPMPFDIVIQQRSGNLTNFAQLGTNAVTGVTTAGLLPLMLTNIAASTTGSACTVGYRFSNLPPVVRAAWNLTTNNGGLSFLIDVMVSS